MNVFIEPLILYMILFLPGSAGQSGAGNLIIFSATNELIRIVLYDIPSLALIWYLLLKVRSFKAWGVGIPRKKDLVSGLLALPSLVLIGFAVSAVSPLFQSEGPRLVPPSDVPGWLILVVSCISTGYLEESFFRFYLISKRDEFGLSGAAAALISVVLFAVCHVYEGPWGFLNAVLAGSVLSFLFLRCHTLHGLAFAHGLYNTLVYIFSSF
ncbi:MAG: CPBP family intramembrane metalloprotease [Treponema sp.]|jgi:membrane protease YdiL (CAAX protease family)|nr:CPBP family intramembrane metalloprotease [Treponema sp.]